MVAAVNRGTLEPGSGDLAYFWQSVLVQSQAVKFKIFLDCDLRLKYGPERSSQQSMGSAQVIALGNPILRLRLDTRG